MGRFIKLLGNRRYSIKKKNGGLEITWITIKPTRPKFELELNNWTHLFPLERL